MKLKYSLPVVTAVTAGGIIAVWVAFAATPVAFEAEQGTVAAGAAIQALTGASGGQAVKFASGSTPTPTAGACPNAPHTPGGSDGMGGCWPYEGNTGVPAGTTLSPYAGPCTILSPTIINAKTINCDFVVKAALTITNSNMNGHFDGDYGAQITITDSEIDGGNNSTPAIGYDNITVLRSEVVGGQHNILCGKNCVVEDSWLHAQYNAPGGSYHNNAYISNGGTGVRLTHNSLFCSPPNNTTGGGCTADGSILGDFAPLKDITFDKNLFVATPSGAYCGTFGHNPAKPFGNNPTNISVTNNIFQRGANAKCGTSAPVTSFMSANGNVWSNNKWDDGSTVPAADD